MEQGVADDTGQQQYGTGIHQRVEGRVLGRGSIDDAVGGAGLGESEPHAPAAQRLVDGRDHQKYYGNKDQHHIGGKVQPDGAARLFRACRGGLAYHHGAAFTGVCSAVHGQTGQGEYGGHSHGGGDKGRDGGVVLCDQQLAAAVYQGDHKDKHSALPQPAAPVIQPADQCASGQVQYPQKQGGVAGSQMQLRACDAGDLHQHVPGHSQRAEGVAPGLAQQGDDDRHGRTDAQRHQHGDAYGDRNAEAGDTLQKSHEYPTYCQDAEQLVGTQLPHGVVHHIDGAGGGDELIQQQRGEDDI